MKFEGLPGIDNQGPQVFESEDVVYKDIVQLEDSQAVDQSTVVFSEAIERFKPKTLDLNDRYQQLKSQVEQFIMDSQEDVQLLEQAKRLMEALDRTKDVQLKSHSRKVFDDLQQFKSKIKSEQPNESTKLVYELSIDGQMLNSQQGAKIVELERRLKNLERLVGIHYQDPVLEIQNDSLKRNMFQSSGTLVQLLERIDQQLGLLTDPLQMDAVQKRSKLLLEEAQKVKINVTQEEQIQYLHKTFLKLEPVLHLLPNLISRLRALKKLHTDSFEYGQRLDAVEEEQQSLKELGNHVKRVQETLLQNIQDNQQRVLKNIEFLQSTHHAVSK